MGFTGFTVVMPFLPLYISQLGVTDPGDVALWSGVTLGVTPALAALCAPAWGRIGDRYGNKILVQRSLIAAIFVMTAMGLATHPWQLLALRSIMGIFAGWGPLTISMAALAAPPGRTAEAIGTVQTAQRIGPTIGPVIGGILAPAFGMRSAFLVSAGLYLIALIGVTMLYHEPRATASERTVAPRTSFSTILAFENLVVLMLVIFGLHLVDRSFGPVLALYLEQLGYGQAAILLTTGIMFSVLAFSAAGGNQLAGRLLKRHSPRQVIAVSVLISAVALALMSVTPDAWLLGGEIAIIGVCSGLALTTAYSAGAAAIPREAHSTAFGFLTGASLLASAVSPMLAGLVGAQSIRIVFVSGVVVLVALAVVVRQLMVDRANPSKLYAEHGES